MNALGTITIETFEPYPNFHPGLFAVGHDTIDFAKDLRAIGFDVEFQPSNSGKIYFLKENADISALAHWVILHLENIAEGVAASFVYDQLKKIIARYRQSHKVIASMPHVAPIVLPTNETLDEMALQKQKEALIRPWVRRFQIEGLPPGYPIYFEHSARIVAWGQVLYEDKVGLKVEDVILLDPEIEAMVKNRREIGCSFGGIVKSAVCGVCKSDYMTCPHIRKRTYNGVKCYVELKDIALAEISLVMNPAQSQAKIRWKK
jgi:hypothetical protein